MKTSVLRELPSATAVASGSDGEELKVTFRGIAVPRPVPTFSFAMVNLNNVLQDFYLTRNMSLAHQTEF